MFNLSHHSRRLFARICSTAVATLLFTFTALAQDVRSRTESSTDVPQQANVSVSGQEIFSREWLANDPRSPDGDGLGPMFNGSSCVACHNLGGTGGAGALGKNVELGSVNAINLRFQQVAPSLQSGAAQPVTSFRKELLKLHPGFEKANTVVIHKFGISPDHDDWRMGLLKSPRQNGFTAATGSRALNPFDEPASVSADPADSTNEDAEADVFGLPTPTAPSGDPAPRRQTGRQGSNSTTTLPRPGPSTNSGFDSPQRSIPQPVAPQPSIPQPLAPQPFAPQQSIPQPVAPQPSASRPSASQVSTPQVSARQPSASQVSAPQPLVAPQPFAPQKSIPQPVAPQQPVRSSQPSVFRGAIVESQAPRQAVQRPSRVPSSQPAQRLVPGFDPDTVQQTLPSSSVQFPIVNKAVKQIQQLKGQANTGLTRQRSIGRSVVQFSQRNTPALFGAGLIDRIPESALVAAAGTRHEDSPQVSGRVARDSKGMVGRFGWKSQKPSLEEFTRAACAVELGLHVPGHAQAGVPYQPNQKPKGLDLSEQQLSALVGYLRELPRPVQTKPQDKQAAAIIDAGEELFKSVGCAACHQRKLGSVDGLYSDLLLHDMGNELGGTGSYGSFNSPGDLANEPPVTGSKKPRKVVATQNEWRTAPLWGVRDSAPYLHDGRANTLRQAIAFHGGESADSTIKFFMLSPQKQQKLIAFLKTLTAPPATKPTVTKTALK